MLSAIYLLCAASSLTLGILYLRRLITAPALSLALILPTVLALPYDSLVIALGRFIGEGPMLVGLSWPRFLLHVLTVPLLVIAQALLAKQAGVGWANHRAALPVALLIAAITLVLGAVGELLMLDLAPHYRDEVLFYSHAHAVGPPPGAVVVLIATLVYGSAIWKRSGWPWLALAALYTIFVQLVPNLGLRSALVNTGEVLFLITLFLAERRFSKNSAPATLMLDPVTSQ